MEYAEAMSETPPAATDEMVAALLDDLGAPALLELTARIGFMNLTARTNIALGIHSEEFAEACGLEPLAQPPVSRRSPRSLLSMDDDPFVAQRSLLFTIAYEMTGSAADAEDVVQEAWLRWDGIGEAARAEVRDPRGYLVRVVTRQALNRMRTLSRQREDYVGEWLPEPLLTSPDVAEDVELAESVSIAMLAVLETLLPTERAVFVLREVFDVPHDEIAAALDKSPAAVRQIARRARQHVAARRPRVDGARAPSSSRSWSGSSPPSRPATCRACSTCSPPTSSRSGTAAGWRRPSRARSAAPGAWPTPSPASPASPPTSVATTLLVNGSVGARVDPGGELETALAFEVVDGRIARILAIRNPHKLGRLDEVAELRR